MFGKTWDGQTHSQADFYIDDRFFIGHQMIFSSFFVPVTGKLKFKKDYFFIARVSPTWYVIVHNHDFLYQVGDTLEKKKQYFSNFSFPVTDTKN